MLAIHSGSSGALDPCDRLGPWDVLDIRRLAGSRGQ